MVLSHLGQEVVYLSAVPLVPRDPRDVSSPLPRGPETMVDDDRPVPQNFFRHGFKNNYCKKKIFSVLLRMDQNSVSKIVL